MYDKLDAYITEFSKRDSSDDYWYDIGFIYSKQLISNFSDEDWSKLMEYIDEKDDIWKKRLVYCLGNHERVSDVDIILKIIDTEDVDLFVMCIDALKEMITENNKSKIMNRNIIQITL